MNITVNFRIGQATSWLSSRSWGTPSRLSKVGRAVLCAPVAAGNGVPALPGRGSCETGTPNGLARTGTMNRDGWSADLQSAESTEHTLLRTASPRAGSREACRRRRPALAGLVVALAGLLTPSALSQFEYQRLLSFGFPEQSGGFPNGLLLASDGALYGATATGGTNNGGMVFRFNKDGSGYTTLHTFSDADGNVTSPGTRSAGVLIEGRDGLLYGTTPKAGIPGRGKLNGGTVFRLAKDGSGYGRLRTFSYEEGPPESPLVEGTDDRLYGTTTSGLVFRLGKDGTGYALLLSLVGISKGAFLSGLIEGRDGALYGQAYHGGAFSFGMVFTLHKDGSGFRILHSFNGTDGEYGSGGLMEGSDGALYGATYWGGAAGAGVVFRLNTDGSGYRVLRSFSRTDGDAGYPERTRLKEGLDGALYGTTLWGGAERQGAIFKLNKDGSGYRVLRSFGADDKPFTELSPSGVLVIDQAGALYGTTQLGGANFAGTVFRLRPDGSDYGITYTFSGSGAVEGDYPASALLLSSDGALYGTTTHGGGTPAYRYSSGNGLVFKVNRDGSDYRVLHRFEGRYVTGNYHQHALIQGRDGVLYGTTELGGTNNRGSVFTLTRDGSAFRTLHDFLPDAEDDGRYPRAGLSEGRDGALFGTTWSGAGGAHSAGTVFRLNKDGSGYAILHQFGNPEMDGAGPVASVVEASDGSLYGTTESGGSHGVGTVFRLEEDGSGYTVLHSFGSRGSDGAAPRAALVEGSDRALYGTTPSGGSSEGGGGTVYKLQKDGTGYTLLHVFPSNQADGWGPGAALVEGHDGALYGTTTTSYYRDAAGPGTVFRLNKDGTGYTVLHRFAGPDGQYPSAALVQASDGTFYGTTAEGGDMGYGTIFALQPPRLLLPRLLSGGHLLLRFTSAPGFAHRLQRAAALDGGWMTFTNVVVPTNGVVEVTDSAPPEIRRFYRTVAP